MTINPRHLSLAVAAFFAVIVAVVFQQIATSMTEQGIASGGPYDNGAAYPRAVAIAIAVLVLVQLALDLLKNRTTTADRQVVDVSSLRRAALLLVAFAIYLNLLTVLGYHLTTAPLIFAIMWICGARNVAKLAATSLSMAFVAAFFFEKVLNVVLPGGYFGLNIPW